MYASLDESLCWTNTLNSPLLSVLKAEHTAGGASWDILRDDFMMGAKMKDWDRQEEGNQKKSRGHKPNMEDYVLENQGEISEESDDEEEEESAD